MNIIFAVTGKAGKSGHEQWRKVNEEDFSTRIYTHSKREATEASRLEIELRNFQGNIYSYYTYLRVKNVAQVKSKEDEEKREKHGRTGSFFGMTIRVQDGYIRDVPKLYSLFETVFENKIKRKIFTEEDTDGYLTYLIEKLADGEETFIMAEKDIFAAITPNDILKLPENCVTQQQRIGEVKTKCFNVEDTVLDSFFPTLFNGAEVNVSREYDTLAEIENRRKQAEKLRTEQEELEKKKRESKEDLILSSNNSPTQTSKEKNNVISSSNVGIRKSPSQHQSINAINDIDSSLWDNPIKLDAALIKQLLKIISTYQKTSKELLLFSERQLKESKNEQKDDSEYWEGEEKLYEINNELYEINNEIEEVKDKLNKLLEKYSNSKEDTRDSLFTNKTPKGFDYKLFLPIGVIIIIVLGIFIGIHNPENDGSEDANVADTAVVADDKHEKKGVDTTNNKKKGKIDTILYKVIDGDARLRDSVSATNYTKIPKESVFKGIDSLEKNGEMWIYGVDESGKSGYTKRSNLK